MRRIIMQAILQRTLVGSLILLSLALPCASHAAGFDQATFLQLEQRITKATLAKDSAAVGGFLADDVEITIEAMGQEHRLTKRQYLAMLQRSWKVIEDYEYQVQDQQIAIESPAKAIVNCTILESLVINDTIVKANSEQETTYELRNGKPIAVKINAHLTVFASVKI